MNLTVVRVLERPPGELERRGWFMMAEHLAATFRVVAAASSTSSVVPAPMMDAVAHALIELGVPDERVRTERFDVL